MAKLLLIDGNAILHRAYHAYPSFTDKDGNPTNAIYGFFAMTLKLLEDVKPEYLVICWDKGAPTFRMNMYAGYHENRPEMTSDLSSQVPRLQNALEKIGIPMFGVEGYEADDLLGTLAVQAVQLSVLSDRLSDEGLSVGQSVGSKKQKTDKQMDTNPKTENREPITVIIVTGDRDLLQLVNGHVKILMPLTGITKTALFGAKEVEEKYGVRPSQFIDYKALIGDASDNYPGVTGIGPKTAANLLQKYETFENIYKHLGELPQKLGERLATDAEQAALAQKLATIQTDAPIHLKIEDANVEKFTTRKFVEIFDELGFDSLKKRMLNDEGLKINDKNPSTRSARSGKNEEVEENNSEQLGLL